MLKISRKNIIFRIKNVYLLCNDIFRYADGETPKAIIRKNGKPVLMERQRQLPEKGQDVPDNKPQQAKENYNIRRVLDKSDSNSCIIGFLFNMCFFIFPVFVHASQVYTPGAVCGQL